MRARPCVFYGWWVVVTASVALFWGVPVNVYTFGVFLKPLMRDFHVGRTAISLAYTLQNIAGAVCAPAAGWFIDRYGARKVIFSSAVMFGLMLVLNRQFSGSLWSLYFFYAALGALMNGVGPIPYGQVISHWFDKSRGLALGLAMFGIGLGATIMPSFAQRLITRFGWHAAYSILGSLVVLAVVPIVILFLKEDPQELGLLPDGVPIRDEGAAVEPYVSGLGLREAVRSRTFWVMILGFFLMGGSAQGCLVHVAALFNDRGMGDRMAAAAASLTGGAVLIGRAGAAFLLDRLFAPHLAALFFSGAAIGMAVLAIGGPPACAFVSVFLVGLSLGAEVDVIAYLASRYFGLRCLGKLYSFCFGAFVLAGALGPLAMGAGYDLTGSYRAPLTILFTAAVMAAFSMTRLGPYRFSQREIPKKGSPNVPVPVRTGT